MTGQNHPVMTGEVRMGEGQSCSLRTQHSSFDYQECYTVICYEGHLQNTDYMPLLYFING